MGETLCQGISRKKHKPNRSPPLIQHKNYETLGLLLSLRKINLCLGIIQCIGLNVIFFNRIPTAWLVPPYLPSHPSLSCSGISFRSQTPPRPTIPSTNYLSDLSFYLPGGCQTSPLTSLHLIPFSPVPVFSEFHVFWSS